MNKKILVLRTISVTNPYSPLSHDKLWDEHNNVTYGIADYYRNVDTGKSWDAYNLIVEWNGNKPLKFLADEIGIMVGVYDWRYYKNKKSPITHMEKFGSVLIPYPNAASFIKYDQRDGKGIDLQFKIDKKIMCMESEKLNKEFITRKQKEFGRSTSYIPLCFTLDYEANNDLINLILS